MLADFSLPILIATGWVRILISPFVQGVRRELGQQAGIEGAGAYPSRLVLFKRRSGM